MSSAGEPHKEIDGHDGLTGARAATNDHHVALASAARFQCEVESLLEDDLLIVDHDEFLLAFEHACQSILERLARAQATRLNLIEHPAVIAVLDVPTDEVPQLHDVARAEHRRPLEVLEVDGVEQRVVPLGDDVVVQIGTWHEFDRGVSHGLVVVLNHPGV